MAEAERTDAPPPDARARRGQRNTALALEWRRLTRGATVLALLTSPSVFGLFTVVNGWSPGWALIATFVAVIAFRGAVDLLAHRLIPAPNLYGAPPELLEDDVVARRRLWYWRTRFRRLLALAVALFALLLLANLGLRLAGRPTALWDTVGVLVPLIARALPTLLLIGLQLPLLFLVNLLILFGPLLFFGIKQMKGYEPGDADWGVRLDDVRGQAEPKEEVRRIISLWQSGEEFRKAGGKPERGLLFLGAPGTGKTMLSKAIATSFNCPFVTMPGSGFAQTFIGMDVVIVLFLVRKARRLARKWGGQCIVFIDEIDAVGMRRQALNPGVAGGVGGMGSMHAQAVAGTGSFHDFCFFGPFGALTPTGDLILESRAWRERLFAERAPGPGSLYPPALARLNGTIQRYVFPGAMGMGGGMALNQLLIQMDGVDDPPFVRKWLTNRVNTFLDATYVIPRRLGSRPLRLPPPSPRQERVHFIGATNVPIEALDPALVRPGRMGRHIWFRTPTKDDRKDIFDLYLHKVDHEADLDSDRRRDELARITNGYSPAMIEQVCSMALTLAHSEGRVAFGWPDIVEAMTTVESGTAVGVEYVPEETRAVAIHEAGHAATGHLVMKDVLSTRLSIRKRGGSLGHHQAIEKEERFSSWRSEEVAKLVWTLGAMAAEHHFYGENSSGVGGDVMSATARAAWMVGMCAMAPDRVELSRRFGDEAEAEAAREKIMRRLERIGIQIMNRASPGGPFNADPLAGVLSDASKRSAAAQLLGQAYVTAHAIIAHNHDQVSRIADELTERREMHGDEVVHLLDAVGLEQPRVDLLEEAAWPLL